MIRASLGIVLIFALSACEEDPVRRSIDETGPQPYPAAASGDLLAANFVAAWQDRNFPEYERLLHEDFQFQFAAEDIDASETGGVWDRARDAASAEKLFSGEPGKIDPDTGVQQAPVQSIVMSLSVESAWEPYTESEFESDITATYSVDMNVSYANGDVSLVTGLHEFYAKQVEVGGESVYQLRVWRDRGQQFVKTETRSFGAIKALF